MNVVNALFMPTGRLRGRPYWLGAGLLLLVAFSVQFFSYQIIMNAENIQGMMMASMGSIVLWLLIYPYFCLYGKRLRDIGAHPAWFCLIIFIYAIVSWVAQMIVMMPVMLEEVGPMFEQLETLAEDQSGEVNAEQFSDIFDAQLEMQQNLLKKTMLPLAIAGIVVSAIFDLIIGILPPKEERNPYLEVHDLIS